MTQSRICLFREELNARWCLDRNGLSCGRELAICWVDHERKDRVAGLIFSQQHLSVRRDSEVSRRLALGSCVGGARNHAGCLVDAHRYDRVVTAIASEDKLAARMDQNFGGGETLGNSTWRNCVYRVHLDEFSSGFVPSSTSHR